MALELYEVFDIVEAAANELKKAVTVDSDGGKTITHDELVAIAVKIVSKLGIDIID